MCDLGAGIESVLYKGMSMDRPAVPCRSLPRPGKLDLTTFLRETNELRIRVKNVTGEKRAEINVTLSDAQEHIPDFNAAKSNASVSSASGSRNLGAGQARNYDTVAVCFVGQFLRSAAPSRPIQSVFRPRSMREHKDVVFDAFISMSTQRDELDANTKVNGRALCQTLTELNFRQCQSSLLPYNVSKFIEDTKHIGTRIGDSYPVRLAHVLRNLC